MERAFCREMTATAEFVRHVLNKNVNGCHSAAAWISLTESALRHHRSDFAYIVDRLPEPRSSAYEYVVRRLLLLDDVRALTWHKIVVVLAFATYVKERFDGCILDRATVVLVEQCLQDWVALIHRGQRKATSVSFEDNWSAHCSTVLAHCCHAINLQEKEESTVTTVDRSNDDGHCA